MSNKYFYRQLFVVLHRYIGLVMVIFLIIAGLTGSLITFNKDLDDLVVKHYILPTADKIDLHLIDPLIVRDQLLKCFPGVVIDRVSLEVIPDSLYSMSITPKAAGQVDAELESEEVFLDIHTGQILGIRKWGDISQGMINLMPFIYRLHFSLALGTVGSYLFGVIALLWTIDCFIGAYLTFPAARKRQTTFAINSKNESWVGRWWQSWKIRLSGGYKTLFDMHRAGGLWPWALLFVLAWSSVGMNLQQVFNPVMHTLFTTQIYPTFPEQLNKKLIVMDWHQARRVGHDLMQQEADKNQFNVISEQALMFDSKSNVYELRVKSSLDINEDYGSTTIFFDGTTGALKALILPSGVASGETVTNWLFALHMGQVWGLPYKIALSITGVIIAMLSITGAYIWWKKRKARNHVKVLQAVS